MPNCLQPHGLQHTRLPCPSPTSGTYTNSFPSHWWYHPTISSSVVPLSSCLQLSQHQGLFQGVSSSYQVAKALEFQLQHQSFQWTPRADLLQNGLVGSPCCPRDSQESSPTPQFKSISSLALSFLCSPTLTSIHDQSTKVFPYLRTSGFEKKKRNALGRKAIIKLDNILKSRDITLPTKVHLVKTSVFPVVMYECESCTIKKAECHNINASGLWCWRRLLRVPWTARRSN